MAETRTMESSKETKEKWDVLFEKLENIEKPIQSFEKKLSSFETEVRDRLGYLESCYDEPDDYEDEAEEYEDEVVKRLKKIEKSIRRFEKRLSSFEPEVQVRLEDLEAYYDESEEDEDEGEEGEDTSRRGVDDKSEKDEDETEIGKYMPVGSGNKAVFPNQFYDDFILSRKVLLFGYTGLHEGGVPATVMGPPHVGNILSDLDMINEPASEDWLFLRKNSFERMYGVTYDWGKDKIRDAPRTIIKTFDIRADVWELDMWQKGEAAAVAEKSIKPGCEKVLEEWKRWVRDGKVGEMPDIRTEFENLKSEYDDILMREIR